MELWIITGVSRGLGASVTRQALQPDRHVIGLSRSGNRTLAGIAQRHGAIYEDVHVDFADLDALATRCDVLLSAMPASLTRAVLINNAAVVDPIAMNTSIDAKALTRSIAVNLGATMILTSRFLGTTEHAHHRQVVHISSGAARRPVSGWAAYCSSKAALDMYARCINVEQSTLPNPAKAVSLAPGVIDTDMQSAVRAANARDFPDVERFRAMKADGQLRAADDVARDILRYLDQTDFGASEIDDLRNLTSRA